MSEIKNEKNYPGLMSKSSLKLTFNVNPAFCQDVFVEKINVLKTADVGLYF